MQPSAPFPERELEGHRARWLATVDEAYAEMERCIDTAANTVRLETYILREEGPATRICAALLRASERGVRVRLLIDAFGSEDVRPGFLASLRAGGVRVAVFNPKRLLRLSFRNHRKLLVVDEESAIVGGFNIGPEYAGDGVSQGWCDTGLLIRGPVALELARSFDAMFGLAPFDARRIRRFRRQMQRQPRNAVRHPRQPGAASARAVELLNIGPAISRRLLRRALRHDLRAAREVDIASGYFLPPAGIRRLLYRVVKNTGRVRILLAGNTDVPLARHAAERFYRRLFRRGISIHEYQPQILHAKLALMDDVIYVGSSNLDRRSLRINYELMLRLQWPELAADARQWFELALQHAPAVDPAQWRDDRNLWQRLRSRLAYLVLARIDPFLARRRFRSIS
jgi:cardiolipin synthase